jgi:hypothetical protein
MNTLSRHIALSYRSLAFFCNSGVLGASISTGKLRKEKVQRFFNHERCIDLEANRLISGIMLLPGSDCQVGHAISPELENCFEQFFLKPDKI